MGMPIVGLGCMSMSQTDEPQQEMIQPLHSAIDSGVTFLDTSDLYGSDANELLNGQALKGGRRDKVQIATKFGIMSVSPETRLIVTGDPVYIKESCNGCLKRLGVDKALKQDVRPKVELATKFGISAENGAYEIYDNAMYVRAACEANLKPIEIDCIDLYYQHRSDTRVPIEITVVLSLFKFSFTNHLRLFCLFERNWWKKE